MLQSMPLWYLVQVGKYQSLSIAAEQLHISQPSLSVAIKKLEEQLGLQLLTRTYRGVALTEDGKKVAELAKKVFSIFDEIENLSLQATTEQQHLESKNIIIYTNPALIQILTLSFQNIRNSKNAADINIQFISIEPPTDIVQLLTQTQNAIALVILNEQFAFPEDLEMFILSKSKSYVICSPDFPYIPQDQTSISFKELLKVPLAVINPGFEFQDTLLHILKQHGTPNIKATVNDLFSLNAMVSSGIYAMFGNKLMSSDSSNTVRYIPIRTAPKFVTGLLYNKAISSDTISTLIENIQPHLI